MANTDMDKIKAAMTELMGAGNPFIGSPNTDTLREHIKAAFDNALEALKQKGIMPGDCVVKSVVGPGNTLQLTISLTPHSALALIAAGLMCPYCTTLSMHDVPEDDVEAMEQGYWPQQVKKCGDCGRYIELSGNSGELEDDTCPNIE